jgi:hypothetical protein
MSQKQLIDCLLDTSINVVVLDGVRCKYCGHVPRISSLLSRRKSFDRSSRVDCEKKDGEFVTYHVDCWFKEIFNGKKPKNGQNI